MFAALADRINATTLWCGAGRFAGSPFKFHVDTIQSGYVTAYGPGLTHGVAGEPSNFTISTKDAGKGSAIWACPSVSTVLCKSCQAT